ncbi:hypothetical protein PIB30_088689 [Stylosanthes scabra]|uniref:Putative plant transposon protein domain-containing protein n=1 Tax=Stylosanthes scabra TaxID=79078 RepID=A0ABU6SUI9_9FABA|nr:hypothetical protein [Stylosanthes scabra]
MVRPHASDARAMALARPRGELGHIWPKLPSCMARSRPPLGASARSRIGTMALVRSRPSTWCSRMSRRKQAATEDATPSRVRSSRNLSRGRDEGWGFMYEDLVRINVSLVRDFCANFSSTKQDHVFLRAKRIPFTEAHIRCYLGIPDEAPDADQDGDFMALTRAYEGGDDMNMAEIYSVIGQEETNWPNNPAINTIPKSINNGILNPRATAWHKIINANIDLKTHGTNFNMKHALLIYVLMAGGEVNLPRIIWDILVLRPTKHPRHLLPYPVFISRITARHELPEFPNDKFHTIRPVDMYVPYGDWRGERARGPARPHEPPQP